MLIIQTFLIYTAHNDRNGGDDDDGDDGGDDSGADGGDGDESLVAPN